MIQSFEDLLARYEDTVAWSEADLLDYIVALLVENEEIDRYVEMLDDLETDALEQIRSVMDDEEDDFFADDYEGL